MQANIVCFLYQSLTDLKHGIVELLSNFSDLRPLVSCRSSKFLNWENNKNMDTFNDVQIKSFIL